jgi:hypothetical protein
MKPRRENGAALVSPMTSDVSRGSARMINLPLAGWNVRSIEQITVEGKSPACEDRA